MCSVCSTINHTFNFPRTKGNPESNDSRLAWYPGILLVEYYSCQSEHANFTKIDRKTNVMHILRSTYTTTTTSFRFSLLKRAFFSFFVSHTRHTPSVFFASLSFECSKHIRHFICLYHRSPHLMIFTTTGTSFRAEEVHS